MQSVSGNETEITLLVRKKLEALELFEVIDLPEEDLRNCVVVRTNLGRDKRIILAGHLDTVPISKKTNNFPTRLKKRDGKECIWGRGTVDMKAGDAVFLAVAQYFDQHPEDLKYDLTLIFYDNEEVDADKNGLGKLLTLHPEYLQGNFAILGEPTSGFIEAGCNGTIRFDLICDGVASHSARAWIGDNAIHKIGKALNILGKWNSEQHTETVEGLDYIESLNATQVSGGIAPNVIPDSATLHINYRFAPSKTLGDAINYVSNLFDGFKLVMRDQSPPAKPGTSQKEVQDFAAVVKKATGEDIKPKYGWTDVARFSQLGIPALNFAPGDPLLCHHDDEHVFTDQIEQSYQLLIRYLNSTSCKLDESCV